MTMRPANAELGVPEPHWEVPPHAPIANMAARRDDETSETAPGAEVQWVNTELQTIASTIGELQSRLEEANSRLSSAEQVQTTEYEIGRLFVEAQRFSEASLAKLEVKVHEVLTAAEAKAIQILEEATEEAQQIRREAQEAAFASTKTVQELQSAITGFTTVNAELLKELGSLNSMLSRPDNDTSPTEIDPSTAPELDLQNQTD